MPNIGPMEIAVVLIIALVILGPKQIPAAGRSLGAGIRNFKSGLTTSEPEQPLPAADAEAPAARQA